MNNFSVEIEIGNLARWNNDERAAITIHKGSNMLIRDGYFVGLERPSKWWHLRAWYKVCKTLWHMPYKIRS